MLACYYLQHFGYLFQFFFFFILGNFNCLWLYIYNKAFVVRKKKGLIYNYLAYIDFD